MTNLEKAKTLGPYRIAIRFQNGEEWTFVLDDLAHARVMDEFFTRFTFNAAAPKMVGLTVQDATGLRWLGM